jgi:hypothetical protein
VGYESEEGHGILIKVHTNSSFGFVTFVTVIILPILARNESAEGILNNRAPTGKKRIQYMEVKKHSSER